MNAAPLGVFDSGIGGLTVAHALFECLPHESVIYFGDTARVPYGPKSPETVRRWAAAARELAPGIEVEATGGITLENVRAYALAGVDFISVGTLTHSVKAADIGLEVQ